MAKVKESHTIKLLNQPDLDVLWYCDDETGYGVEMISEDTGLRDFEFGDNSNEAYLLSHAWYRAIIQCFKDYPNDDTVIDNLSAYHADGDYADMRSFIKDTLGFDPLNPLNPGTNK